MITMASGRGRARCWRRTVLRFWARQRAVRRLRPEVVLLDVQLPGIDGFEVAERLATEADPPAVVLISSRERHSYRRQLATSPVRGFITKGELSGECLSELVF